MYAVEFEAPIENGVVRIPEQYKELQQTKKARFLVMYDTNKATKRQNISDELDELFTSSNNKVQATMDIATNIDEMINDGIL